MNVPYEVLMVDPPWPMGGVFRSDGAPGKRGPCREDRTPYQTVTWKDVWALLDTEVLAQAAPHHALFLWALEQFLPETEAELTRRGYRRTHRLIWDKNDGPFIGTVRRTHEYLLWWCNPRLLPIAASQRGVWPTVIRASNGKQHSRKPSAAYQMVEALYPDARKLDAFSRAYRVGWDAYGDQVDMFTPLLAPLREGNQ